MHGGEVGDILEGAPANQLEAASGVRGVVVQAEAANSVGDPGLQPFEAAVVAAGAPPAHDAERRVLVLCRHLIPDAARIGRIVLAVPVEQLHPVAARAAQAGQKRRRLAAPLHMGQHDNPARMRLCRASQLGGGRIAGGVVDAYDLVVEARERGMHLVQQRLDIPGLVVERYQHGKGAARLGRHVQGPMSGAAPSWRPGEAESSSISRSPGKVAQVSGRAGLAEGGDNRVSTPGFAISAGNA